MINKLLSWIFTPLHLIAFGMILLVFHFLQLAGYLFSYRAHKWAHQTMCCAVLWNLRIFSGARLVIKITDKLPKDRPIVFVANHQSLYDIPFFYWHLREYHPKFVAKKELGRWIPGVSFALRNAGNVLIDRKDPRQSITAVKQLGKRIEERKWSACIFPEGTRARDGVMKEFKAAGVVALLNSAPSAVTVPVAIKGSWEFGLNGFSPIPFGKTISFTVLDPIEPSEFGRKKITAVIEERVKRELRDPA